MSTLPLNVIAGAAGGAVVAASRETARYLRRRVRRLSRPKHRATRGPATPSAAAQSSNARAAYRAAQVRAYADHLARGDVRLRERLRRFEQPVNGSEHQGGDRPW